MLGKTEAIRLLFDELHWIDVACGGMEIPGDDRHRLGLASTDLLHEHARSILHLLNARPGTAPMIGSALALLRPLFEALVRSWLILYVCSDAEIENHVAGGELKPKYMADKIASIEAVAGLRHDGFLSRVMQGGFWRTLSGFAHGGMEQLARRVSPTHLGPNYSESDELLSLLIASEFSLIAATVALEIGGRMALAEEAQHRLGRLAEYLTEDGATIRITEDVQRISPTPEK
jgi:hypothetical protein